MITITEDIVPSTISNLIEQQFPNWFVEQGPIFIDFVKAYYQWMEQANNTLYYSRKYYNIKDIDTTLDQFIIYFKEKYLKNIQLTTKTDTRMLVKHALDIYRSKGTERSVKLLFQLVFDENIGFYYPSTDLFKLSDGQWYRPVYLELMLFHNNVALVNKEIKGLNSGAIAFVDSVVRRITKGHLEDVAYISAIQGTFQVNEKVQPTDGSLAVIDCPFIVGSLTNVTVPVSGIGQNFSNGDIVDISSNLGEKAQAVVTGTINQFGVISLIFNEGGYGYNVVTNNDVIYISNTMFTMSNLSITSPGVIQYFSQFDLFTQNQVFLNYHSATGNFVTNQDIFTYFANGNVMGHGSIITINQSNTTAGILLVGVISGNLNNTFYTTSNVVTANLNVSNGYFATAATGKFVANDAFINLTLGNVVGTFIQGEDIYQPSSRATISFLSNTQMTLVNIDGIVHPDLTLTGLVSGAVANIASIQIGVGLSNVAGVFSSYPFNVVSTPNMSGTISKVEQGNGFNVAVANTFTNQETVLINTDLISNYLTTNINATSYGFPANTSANLTSVVINNALTYQNVTIGKITNIIESNPGVGYTKPPFVIVEYPAVRALQYHNAELQYSGATGSFSPGELVTQAATNARGMVLAIDDDNPNGLYIENMRFYQNNWFVVTSNSTTKLVGSHGSVANVTAVSYDYEPDVMAHNEDVSTSFSIGNGAILTLQVTDSGFGFLDHESVFINGDMTVNAYANVIQQGVGRGYYRQKGGFLDDQKKLFDGFFYQNFSYQVISRLVMTKYQDMLKQLTHVAGTIMFGQLKYDTYSNNTAIASLAKLTLS